MRNIIVLVLCFLSFSSINAENSAYTKATDSLEILKKGYWRSTYMTFICKKNDYYGIIHNGEIIVPPVYDFIEEFYGGFIIVKGKLAGLADGNGNELLPIKFKYMYIASSDQNVLSMVDSLNLQCTYCINTKEFRYRKCGPFFLKSIKEGVCLSDSNGVALSDEFNMIMPFKLGRALAKKDSVIGFIDLNGKFTEEPKYRNCDLIKSDGIAYKMIKTLYDNTDIDDKRIKKTTCCLLDSAYNIRIPFEYDDLTTDSTFIIAKKNGKFGIISFDNNILIPLVYEKIETTGSRGVFIAKKGGKTGIISYNNKIVVPFNYDYLERAYVSSMTGGTVWYFEDGKPTVFAWDGMEYSPRNYYHARRGKKECLLSLKGNLIANGRYVDEQIFCINGKKGVISEEKVILPAVFSSIHQEVRRVNDKDFYFYIVTNDKNQGIYSTDAKCIVPVKYKEVSFTYGDDSSEEFPYFEVVDGNDNKGIYSITGKCIVPAKYDRIEHNGYKNDKQKREYYVAFDSPDNIYIYYTNGKHHHIGGLFGDAEISEDLNFLIVESPSGKEGVYSLDGKKIIPVKYDSIEDNTNEKLPYFLVEDENGKVGAFSIHGKCLLPVKYENIHFDEKNNKLVGN